MKPFLMWTVCIISSSYCVAKQRNELPGGVN